MQFTFNKNWMDTCWGQPPNPVSSSVVEGKAVSHTKQMMMRKWSLLLGSGTTQDILQCWNWNWKYAEDMCFFKKRTGSTTCVSPW